MSDSAQEKMAQVLQDQQAQWSSLVSKALDSSIRLVELNLKMTRQAVEESSQSAREMLKVKSPEQLFTLDQGVMQERLSQAMHYASEIGAIASEFASEFNQAAQNQLNGNLEKMNGLTAGIEQPAAVKNLFPDSTAAQQGYEQWMNAGKKFVESFGQNFAVPFNGAAITKQEDAKVAPASKARTRTR